MLGDIMTNFLVILGIKVAWKYALELVSAYSVIAITRWATRVKGWTVTIWILHSFGFENIVKILLTDIHTHKINTSLHLLKAKDYLRYVNNEDYRKYLRLIVDIVHDEFLIRLDDLRLYLPNMMFKMNQSEFLLHLEKALITVQSAISDRMQSHIGEGELNHKFSDKYMIWTDVLFSLTINRLHDLVTRPNNYHAYKGYLFIICDFISFFNEKLPQVVNTINGDVLASIEFDKKCSVCHHKSKQIAVTRNKRR